MKISQSQILLCINRLQSHSTDYADIGIAEADSLQGGEEDGDDEAKNQRRYSMRCIKKLITLTVVVAGLFALCAVANALVYHIDENGLAVGSDGSTLPYTLGPDPTGGVPGQNVLIYTLPFAGVQGDIIFGTEGGIAYGGDVVRFDGQGHLIFYSDDTDGYDALADTYAPPSPLYPNQLTVPELGDEDNNGNFFIPLSGQPGYDATGPQYYLISDGTYIPGVPDGGATVGLLALGLAGLWRIKRRS